jgi:hypothetical protein
VSLVRLALSVVLELRVLKDHKDLVVLPAALDYLDHW